VRREQFQTQVANDEPSVYISFNDRSSPLSPIKEDPEPNPEVQPFEPYCLPAVLDAVVR
jgi:hypothetical protein